MTIEPKDTTWAGEKEIMPGVYLTTPQSRTEHFTQARIRELLGSSDLGWLNYEATELHTSIKALLYSNQELKQYQDDQVCVEVCFQRHHFVS
jgi:hypothetical protein